MNQIIFSHKLYNMNINKKVQLIIQGLLLNFKINEANTTFWQSDNVVLFYEQKITDHNDNII